MDYRESIKKYRESLSGAEARILSDLSFKGKGIFTLDDVKQYDVNSKDLLYNLIKKNWVLRIEKGLYMIAPLEAGELGAQSYTVHGFVLASHLVEPYYIGYWSALNYYGFTEQTPPAVYIATTKPRNGKYMLDTQFIFVTVAERKMFGSTEIEIENSPIKISTPEKTVADCLDHPEHCGGIEEVAKAIYFEHNDLNIEEILRTADKMGNRTIIKRLGYLTELLGFDNYGPLFEGVKLSKGYSNLDPKLPKKGRVNERWKLRINAKIDPEQWMR
jgi:predicted transcriptional regulator of viral defense system